MKNIYLHLTSCLLALLSTSGIKAQVSAYYFTQNLITYNAVSGGTVFGTTSSDDDYFCNPASPQLNQNTGPGIPIGFNFTFNGTVYDCFGINNNGWIFFGQSTLTPNPVNGNSSSGYTGLSATSTAPAALQNRVAGFSRDIQAQAGASLRVETIGATPNRTCVIQWGNYKKFGTNGTGDIYNFQIRLLETSNIVDVIYGTFVNNANGTGAEVGLRGNANTDYNNRITNATTTWSVSIPGTANNSAVNTSATLTPLPGQAYRWIPAVLCSGVPSTTAVAASTLICPGVSVLLTMNNSYSSYTNTGVSFQWYSATSSSGPYTAVTGATNTAFVTPSTNVTSFYLVVPTCSVGPVSTTATAAQVSVGAPATSSAIANLTLICPNGGSALSLSSSYAGVSYQWMSSTSSAIGPFTPVSNATLATYSPVNIAVNTWYQAIVTCTASPSSSVATSSAEIQIAATTINNVPYLETFEGILLNNQLPNCSWAASNPTTVCQTYTTANTSNRIPHSGQKFASFRNATNVNGDYFYSNGIQLVAGVTYSAAAWYITDGNLGWSNFSLLYGSAQSSSGLTSIASVTGAVTGQFYQLLSGTFSVNTSGVYYIAVKCIGNATPQFLSWDDLSVTIPCQLNAPQVTVNGLPTGNVCSGTPLILSAVGADDYYWSNGSTSSTATLVPTSNTSYTLVATSTLSGCSSTIIIPVNTDPSPAVGIVAMTASICAGSSATLTAFGATSYSWSNTTNGAVTVVSPNATTSYTVIGINTYGCIGEAMQTVVVNPRPVVTVNASVQQICVNETATLTAFGALSYEWKANTLFLQVNPVVVSPNVTTSYTVTGTNANGCKNEAVFNLNVDPCVGLNEINAGQTLLKVYPNPANDRITIDMNGTSIKTIRLTDISGRVLSVITTEDNTSGFDLQGLAAGVYYVKVQSAEGSGVSRFVKH